MEETIDAILEKIEFEKKDLFKILIQKCIHESSDSTISSYATHPNVIFKTEVFFKGFPTFINEFGKDKKYVAGVHALMVILEELGIEIEKEECFILFHIRNAGKFKIKETKLLEELKSEWARHKEYKLENQDFSYALKNLMRIKLIDYRKGNLQLKPNILIRYRH